MSKITSFSLKNRKNCPALGALPADPLCLRRLRATLPDLTFIYLYISLQNPPCARVT